MFKRQTKINRKSFGSESPRLELPGRSDAPSRSRAEVLRAMLADLRSQEIQRLKSLVRSELGQEHSSPGDVSDAAQVQESMESNVSLIGISENRLEAIWAAFDRLENGHYGLCEECAEEIAFERLRALPTALCCVDCQGRYEARDRAGRADRFVAESEETLADTAAPRIPEECKDHEISEAGQHEKGRGCRGHRRELRQAGPRG